MKQSEHANCLVIAGEKSGEEHLLSFLGKLQQYNPDLSFWGVGGDELQTRGVELVYHLNDFSSWGFSEVISKIPFYYSALNLLVAECHRRQCKMALLIDFQDFNLRLAQRLARQGVKVFYYVAPQAWVWKPNRAKIIGRCVHTLFTILPFEKEWFKQRGVKRIITVENPVLTRFQQYLSGIYKKKQTQIVLLPGSRNFEVRNLLPLFLKSISLLQKEYDFEITVVTSSSVNPEVYVQAESRCHFISNEHLGDVLQFADIAIAASGTVTLSTALFQIPTIVTYKSSYFNKYIFDTFLSYDGPVSLVNIIFNKYIFPELIQDDANVYNIVQILKEWLQMGEAYHTIKQDISSLPSLLAGEGVDVGEYIGNESLKIYDE